MRNLAIAALLVLLYVSGKHYVELLEENRALQKKLDATPSCQAVAVEQCMAFWFTGNPTEKFDHHKRICGKRK